MDNFTKKQILNELGDISESVYDSLVRGFIIKTPDKIILIKDALKNGNSNEAGTILHSIIGTAGNLRLEGIFKEAQIMRQLLKEGQCDEKQINEALGNLERELIKYKAEFLI